MAREYEPQKAAQYADRNARRLAQRNARKAAGLCAYCGAIRRSLPWGRYKPTRTLCGDCAQKKRLFHRRPEVKARRPPRTKSTCEKDVTSRQTLYDARKAARKCTACGKNRDAGPAPLLKCYACRERTKALAIARRGEVGGFKNAKRVFPYVPNPPVGVVYQLTVHLDGPALYAWNRYREREREKLREQVKIEKRNQRDRGTLPPPGTFVLAPPLPPTTVLIRALIRRWREQVCWPRWRFSGRRLVPKLSFRVGVALGVTFDAECLQIVERDAALYTGGNKSEVIRCMLQASYPFGSTKIALGPLRQL